MVNLGFFRRNKQVFILLFSAALLANGMVSCKKEHQGKTSLRAAILYSGKDTVPGPAGADDTSKYTQFGAFIGRLTPRIFTAKFNTIRFQDTWRNDEAVVMELINIFSPYDDPQRFADFSLTVPVEMQPSISWGNKTGYQVTEKKVHFAYFYWFLHWFYQKLDLPSGYVGVQLRQFNTEFNYILDKGGIAQNGLELGSDHYPFIDPLFGTAPGELPSNYVFGNTDSTFVYNLDLKQVGNNKDSPMGGIAGQPIIRSNQYEPLDFIYSEGKEMKIRAVVTFDFENLIHIYAGPDQQAYTNDDIFVYAPRFWERLKVRVVQEP